LIPAPSSEEQDSGSRFRIGSLVQVGSAAPACFRLVVGLLQQSVWSDRHRCADRGLGWAIVAKEMLHQDSTGHKLLLKLRHWYGESIPPKILLDWARKNDPRGFLFVANLLHVKSGQPSESARFLVREARTKRRQFLPASFQVELLQVQSQVSWNVSA